MQRDVSFAAAARATVILLVLCSTAPTATAQLGYPTNALRDATEKVDAYHAVISRHVENGALRLDEWLSRDEEPGEEPQDTVLAARLSVKVSRDKGLKVNPAFSGKISLPRFEKRVHVFADNLARGVLPGEEEERTQKNELRAGISLDLHRKLRSLISLDGGVNLRPLPDPFSTLTAKYVRPFEDWKMTLSQQGYWDLSDGFGEVSEMDWDYPLHTNVNFRSITAATWSETTKGVEFEQTLRVTWIIKPSLRSLQGGVSVFANKAGPFWMENYRLLVSYKRQIFRPWFFMDFAPQIDFPKEQDYQFTPSFRVGMTAYFGAAQR